MKCDRSNVLGLAPMSCKFCRGNGIRFTEKRSRQTLCNCVYRAVFRACCRRFRECSQSAGSIRVSLDTPRGPQGRQTFSRKREEFVADFCLISRRVLDDEEHRLFRYHILLGADWRLCSRMLKMDRGVFFHTLYRIQQKAGRAFAEMEPYPLFPFSRYFEEEIGRPAPPPQTPPAKQMRDVRRIILPLSA